METYTNKFLVGDNLLLLQELPSESVDCIYTDPIYNTGRNFHESASEIIYK